MRKSYILRDRKLVEVHKSPRRVVAPEVSPDVEAFVSPVDNSVIGSKSHRREHNKRNDCTDIGNDPTMRKHHEYKSDMSPEYVHEVIQAMEQAPSYEDAMDRIYSGDK